MIHFPRIINDSVHGQIELDNHLMQFVDSPYYQRLRGISQLGCVSYVFPGATHSRFSHGIGTAHLSNVYLSHLSQSEPHLSEEKLRKRDKEIVEIAALCHDIGHGPFSHAFDDFICNRIGSKQWNHEERSCQIVEKIIDEKGLDFNGDDVKKIQSIVKPGICNFRLNLNCSETNLFIRRKKFCC
ncbi:hypothetical protein MHBO_001896 [Bonamia ostreae]|uniref:HD/PDEase domain-containing protein n=1 Tax=Bonamia ostreae TaxID=126728 RepID=A0ABV2AKP2_9EUKA